MLGNGSGHSENQLAELVTKWIKMGPNWNTKINIHCEDQ